MDRRVTVFRNGFSAQGGKVLLITQSITSLWQLLHEAAVKLGIPTEHARRIFLAPAGGELDDLAAVRDDDILHISDGADFMPAITVPNAIQPLCNNSNGRDWVTLNVGGQYFTTARSTLVHACEPDSMLARMFAEDGEGRCLFTPSNLDSRGAYLIDRAPAYFAPILNFLRSGRLVYDDTLNPEGLLDEARFFGIESIIPELEKEVEQRRLSRDQAPLTRRDVVDTLIRSPFTAELRFQGVNLAGADLSKLDLRFINFKYANLHGCNLRGSNLSYCCLERADLSHAELDGAQLLGVKSLCANLEGARLRNCNFKDPAGNRANMEGVNLKSADLEGSDMGGVNLRVAALKDANLKNCDLRTAVLAGADLENCNLSGSDLHEANLRGANLKGAAFELMLTPLHMSQTMS